MGVATSCRKPLWLITGLALAAVAGGALAAVVDMPGGPAVRQFNLAAPVTTIASQIYDLHMVMLAICAVIFCAVFGVMFYSVYAHRKSKGHKAATFHESTTVEIAWTIVPMIIVIVMAGLATKTVLAMKDTSNADLTIKATGHQGKWGYDYIKGGSSTIARASVSTPPWRRRASRSRAWRKRASTTCWRLTTKWWYRSARRCAF